jgi:membrane protease YdiL (CAAX protease family)
MLRFIKTLLLCVFSAHVIALGFVGFILRGLYSEIGTTHTHVVTSDTVVFGAVMLGVVLVLGWLAGTEFRGTQVRKLRATIEAKDEQRRAMQLLQASMVDDVLMAARNGLPVKTFPYSNMQAGPKAPARDLEADYIGRL